MSSTVVQSADRTPRTGLFVGSDVHVITSWGHAGVPCYCGLNVLAPGHVITPHWHPGQAELQIVLAGRGAAFVNGETIEVGPGDTVFCPGDLAGAHGFYASGDAPLEVLFTYPDSGGEMPPIEVLDIVVPDWPRGQHQR